MSTSVSVVIPAYAVEAWLAMCLDSLLAQTLADWEAIIVIDGSPDASESIARDYAARDERIRVITRPNGGLGAARNTGLDAAEGEYLAFVDSDDLLTAEALERLLAAARAGEADLVLSAADDVHADGSRVRYWTQRGELHAARRDGLTAASDPAVLLDHVAWAKLYRRDWYQGLGIRFPEGVHTEDLVPWAQAALRARRISVIPEVTYLHRRHDMAISADYLRPRTLRDWIGQSGTALELVLAEGTRDAARRYLREFITRQWRSRARDFDRIDDAEHARLFQNQARTLARLVRETGVTLPSEVSGLLGGIASGWAVSPPRSRSGESLNPLSTLLDDDPDGIASRARRLRQWAQASPAQRDWLRGLFHRLVVVPMARLSPSEAARIEDDALGALRALFPGRRRFALLHGRRAQLGALVTGGWRARPQLERLLAEQRARPIQAADVAYRGRPVRYFPAWDGRNPFLTMLHLEARGRMRDVAGLRNHYRMVRWLREDDGQSIFHLHWTAPLVERGETPEDAERAVDTFLEALDAWRGRGGRFIWTVHNVLPHDTGNAALGRRLHQALADRADVIHVMTRGTAEAIGDAYRLPEDKAVYIPHGSYHGVYGMPEPRAEARAALGVADDAVAVLAFGQVRPYKGHDAVVGAVIERHRAGQRIHLLVAGKSDDRTDADALIARATEAGVPVTAHLDHIPVPEVARWFSAADIVAMPYQRILNSGTAMLAVAYGVPFAITRSPGVVAEYDGQPWARLLDAENVREDLARSLAEEWYLEPAVRDAAMAFASERMFMGMSTAYADVLDELDPLG